MVAIIDRGLTTLASVVAHPLGNDLFWPKATHIKFSMLQMPRLPRVQQSLNASLAVALDLLKFEKWRTKMQTAVITVLSYVKPPIHA